jgi:hypothetical protein
MRFPEIFLISLLLSVPGPTCSSTEATYLKSPYGKENPLISPGGKQALWGDYQKSTLELQDSGLHTSRTVIGITLQTMSLAWSPDSRHFAVNDRRASDLEDAYLFDTSQLERINLRERLTAVMPKVKRFYLTGGSLSTLKHGRDVLHSYLHVLRWLDYGHVELQLHGNTSGRFAHDNPDGHLYPAQCFDLRFNMGVDGSVREMSERLSNAAPDEPACR